MNEIFGHIFLIVTR